MAGATGSGIGGGGIAATPAPMQWGDLLGQPMPASGKRIYYGKHPLQFAELWLPKNKGPHPVVLMVHGGCWQTSIADLTIMNYLAADLAKSGIAVWNVEYRGVDRPGGGYPGTFLDVGLAADALRTAAPVYGLKIDWVVAVGHSAGGHLALWLAGRMRLPTGSALHSADPLHIAAVVSAGGLPDLEAARTLPGNDCGAEAVPKLVGTPSASRPDVYADTSVTSLLPLNVPQYLVNGALDRIAPASLAQDYAAKARRMGDVVRVTVVPGSGHVELIAPGTAAWNVERAAIERELGIVQRGRSARATK